MAAAHTAPAPGAGADAAVGADTPSTVSTLLMGGAESWHHMHLVMAVNRCLLFNCRVPSFLRCELIQ